MCEVSQVWQVKVYASGQAGWVVFKPSQGHQRNVLCKETEAKVTAPPWQTLCTWRHYFDTLETLKRDVVVQLSLQYFNQTPTLLELKVGGLWTRPSKGSLTSLRLFHCVTKRWEMTNLLRLWVDRWNPTMRAPERVRLLQNTAAAEGARRGCSCWMRIGKEEGGKTRVWHWKGMRNGDGLVASQRLALVHSALPTSRWWQTSDVLAALRYLLLLYTTKTWPFSSTASSPQWTWGVQHLKQVLSLAQCVTAKTKRALGFVA